MNISRIKRSSADPVGGVAAFFGLFSSLFSSLQDPIKVKSPGRASKVLQTISSAAKNDSPGAAGMNRFDRLTFTTFLDFCLFVHRLASLDIIICQGVLFHLQIALHSLARPAMIGASLGMQIRRHFSSPSPVFGT